MSGLFIAMLDPVGAYGVGQHTVYYYDTLGRARRSLLFFAGAVFGDSATADKVGRDLFRKHSHVNGEIPGSGEQFRANHVEALKFTYIAGWQLLWRAYKAYGDPNATMEDERQFYAEQHIVAELLGIPTGELPLRPRMWTPGWRTPNKTSWRSPALLRKFSTSSRRRHGLRCGPSVRSILLCAFYFGRQSL